MAIYISDGNSKYAFKTSGVVDYNSAYTVAFAVRFADFGNGAAKAYVWSDNATSGNNWDALGTNSSGNLILGVASAADGTNAETTGSTALSLNTWYHVVIVRNSATDRKVYLNGVQEISATTATTSRTAAGKEFVGTRTDGYGCNAAFSDFMHWNRALSVGEIAAHRRGARPVSLNGLVTWVPTRRTTIAAAWAALKGQTWDNNFSAPSVIQGPWLSMGGRFLAIGSDSASESSTFAGGGVWGDVWGDVWFNNLSVEHNFAAGLPSAWSSAYTRASTATRVASDGIVRFVPHNLWKNKTWASGASAYGTSPPTVTSNQTVDGIACLKIDFPTGATGWNSSRVENVGGNNALSLVASTVYRHRALLYLSRPLVGAEQVRFDITGTSDLGMVVLTSATPAGQWVDALAPAAITHVSGGTYYPTLFPWPASGALGAPLTVYIARGMLTMGAADPGEWVAGVDDTNQYFGSAPLDHNPSTLEPLGIVVEGQGINYVPNSDAFGAATWTTTNATVTSNATTGPDGTAGADLVLANSTNGTHGVALTTQAAISGNEAAHRIFVKPNGCTKVGFKQSYGSGAYATFDLSGSGSVLASGYGASVPTIEPLQNGWYLISMRDVYASQKLDIRLLSESYVSGDVNVGAGVWSGDGTTGIYVAGGGLGARGSYIPNPATSGTVTRAAASLILTGTQLTNEIGPGATGTIKTTFYVPALGSSDTAYAWELANADRSVRAGVWIDGATMTARMGIGAGSVSLGAVTAGSLVTVEASWGTTGMSARLNGGTIYESAASFDGTACTKLAVMSNTVPAAQLYKPMGSFISRKFALLTLPA